MFVARIRDSHGRILLAASTDTITWFAIKSGFFESVQVSGEQVDPAAFLAPIDPPAIFGIGQNYKKHAEEMGSPLPKFPVVFMKNPASVCGQGDAIQLPQNLRSGKVDYEAELAVIIGKTCKNATQENALEFVWGYTCANDVSARDWQKEWSGGQFCKGKGFDTFCPLGPWIALADEIPDPQSLAISSIVSGETMQNWTTADMIYSVSELIAFLSGDTTLLPGTVILTGTPHGVGAARTPPRFLHPGDTVEINIEKIGSLVNSVH